MINLDWVKDYIDIADEDLKELAVKITKAGINIESVISNHIDNLVIGKVLTCINHPDSDHLHICTVDVGDKVQQIVCGAPNVRENLKVIVALPGATLPGNFEIKASKIRGVESNGMICALFELGLEEKTEENYNKGIFELDDEAPIGKDPLVYLGLANTLYELDIHKHRNNDCYYHIGFAYEIACILNKKVNLPDDQFKEIDDSINNHFTLEVNTPKCTYYLAKMVTDIKVGPSPDFIQKRLISVGMRPINNVVDISNYVMLEYGQPLHFFDKEKLGNKIVVRDAKQDERIITLDGKERVLDSSDIVITDSKVPVCVAGVMGGENTEVDEKTKTILIESAIFASVSIRYTAKKLDLKSEASIRYGKGLNYEYTEKAINRACHLLEKYAGAKILKDTVKFDNVCKDEKTVEFTEEDISKMLGITISSDDVKIELNRLDFPFEVKNNKFIVTIPKRRLDIDPNINDIAEEIGRLYGYQNLVSTLPKLDIKKGGYVGDVKIRKTISKRLRSLGLNEVKTYTLVSPEMANIFNYEDKKCAKLPNPMSIDKSVIRTTLIPSLLNVYDYNKARKVENICIYEISKTYDVDYNEDIKISILMEGNLFQNKWQNSGMRVDFYLLKGVIENILNYLGFENRYLFYTDVIDNLHPGMSASISLDKEIIGIIGRIHPSLKKDDIYVAEISMTKLMKRAKAIKYIEPTKYPEVKKDLAFIVPKDTACEEVEKIMRKSAGKILTNIEVFDVYTGENVGENEKSIAFSLTFSDPSKTLTEDEITNIFNKIIDDVQSKTNFVLRSK